MKALVFVSVASYPASQSTGSDTRQFISPPVMKNRRPSIPSDAPLYEEYCGEITDVAPAVGDFHDMVFVPFKSGLN